MEKKNSANLKTFIISMIPAGVALNVVASSIVETVKLPIFLNNIGTMLNAIVLGPGWGMLTAALTNTILALTVRWTFIPFIPVGMLIAYLSWFFFHKGLLNKLWKLAVSGAIGGILATLLATVIAVYVFGGIVGHSSDIITGSLIAIGQKIFNATFLANLVPQMADKIISLWIVTVILKIFPGRLLPNATMIRQRLGLAKNN